MRPLFLLFAAGFGLVSAACTGNGGEPRPTESTPLAHAFEYLESLQGSYGLVAPREQLTLLREQRDPSGSVHLRFQQVHEGVPVFGSEFIAHLDANLQGRAVTGRLLAIPENTTTTTSATPEKARKAALAEPCAEQTSEPELVLFTGDSAKPELAFRVPANRGLLKCDVFVSAADMRVLGRINRAPSTPVDK